MAKRWSTAIENVRSDLILSGHTHGGQLCLPSPGHPNRGHALLIGLLWLDSILPRWISRYLPGRRYFNVIKNWRYMQGLFPFQPATPDTPGSYLYVNRGLADVHRRLFCDPELTVFSLVPAEVGLEAAITTGTAVPARSS